MSCNYRTDSVATEADCFSFWNFDFARDSSTSLFRWSKPDGQVGTWLESLGVKASNLFISWAIWRFLSSTDFFKASMFAPSSQTSRPCQLSQPSKHWHSLKLENPLNLWNHKVGSNLKRFSKEYRRKIASRCCTYDHRMRVVFITRLQRSKVFKSI